MAPIDATLRGTLGLDWVPWMMAPSERLAIIGLVASMRPERALEFGSADGGLTKWLSRYCGHVVSVDIEDKVLRLPERHANVEPLCMTTEEAARRFATEGRRFDLAVIDADHSGEGVRRDLESLLPLADVILLHDTYNPGCRAGILEVLAGRNVYHDLDLVPGGLQPDGLWGGLGIVVPGIPREATLHVMPRRSTFGWLRFLWDLRRRTAGVRARLRRLVPAGRA